MSLPIIRRAFERHLGLISTGIATAYQNDSFTPDVNLPFQRVDLIPNTPDNQEMGDRSYVERGLFQITLAYPLNKGSGAAEARAQAIRLHFRRGLVLLEAGLRILVTKTPAIAPALLGSSRYEVPITVEWQCHVGLAAAALGASPINLVPVAQTVAEDTALVFSVANARRIFVVSGTSGVSLTCVFSVTVGTVTATVTAGATITGNGTNSVTVEGTAAAINGAVAALTISAAVDFYGTNILTMTTTEGALAPVVSTVAITVTPVVDIAADAASTAYNTPVTINVFANDSFENTGAVITAIGGLSVVSGQSVPVTGGTITLDPTGLIFTPTAGFSGVATSSYTVTSGGAIETAALTFTVAAPPPAFTPADIFVNERLGGWYEFLDSLTLSQSNQFVDPVTAVGQGVGLVLDKRLGLGPELISNGANFINTIGWSGNNSASISAVGGELVVSFADGAAYPGVEILLPLVVGNLYEITSTVRKGTSPNPVGINMLYSFGGGINKVVGTTTSNITTTFRLAATQPTGQVIFFADVPPSVAGNFSIVGLSIKQIKGNHLTQATSPARLIHRQEAGGIYYSESDGLDDCMTSAAGGNANSGFFYCCVTTPTGVGGFLRTLWSDSSLSSGCKVQINAANQLSFGAGDGSVFTTIASAVALISNVKVLLTVWDDGINLNVQINNGPIASIVRPSIVSGTQDFTIGKDNGSNSAYYPGNMFVKVYRTGIPQITAAERANIQAYCKTQAGLIF